MMRPTMSMVTSCAAALTMQPMAVIRSMPLSTFLRPAMSARRGRNSENSAAAVKNTVCVLPISVAVVFNSFCIATSAGESIEALSWKAKMATSSATMRATMFLPPSSRVLGLVDSAAMRT